MTASFRRMISSWGKFFELLFFPSFCELCRSFLEKPGEKIICLSCQAKIRPEASPYCPCCGRFFEGAGGPHICAACLEKRPPLAKHRSCARYKGIVKDIILLFKYRGYEILGRHLGDFVSLALSDEIDLWEGVEAIIPVPLHPKKQKARGFNQSQVLAKRLARHKNIRLMENRLVKVKNAPPQTSLEAGERAENVRGAYRVRKAGDLEGKIVLLVDDVYTTGSTLRECSAALRKAGVKEVRAVTVAQA